MLPKVSSAISKHIKPISTSKSKTEDSTKKEKDPNQGKKQKKDSPDLKLVESPEGNFENTQSQFYTDAGKNPAPPKEPQKVYPPAPENKDLPPPQPGLSVSHTFLNMLNVLEKGRKDLLSWIALGTYQKSKKKQKKSGRVRKGALFDKKAD